jgi:hypothetical protein
MNQELHHTMLKNPSLRTIILIWLAWAVLILGYQTLVDNRIHPERPDRVVSWTEDYTKTPNLPGHIYLNEPFMNRQVAMDSEYYLSIAVAGYDDTNVDFARTPSGRRIPLNYAFFPLYPSLMGALSVPLGVLNLNPIATAALAGVLVSLAGALAGLIALYDLTRDELENAGGIRAAFYLLIFPTGFYLAQVYTEGLFVGLAFGSLALMRRKHLLLAGILAALATWTRSVGLALVFPLTLALLNNVDWQNIHHNGLKSLSFSSPRPEGEGSGVRVLLFGALAIALPLIAYFIWRSAFGKQFDQVDIIWFGRELFDFEKAKEGWDLAFKAIAGDNLQSRVYYLLEITAVVLGVVSCLFTLRRYSGVALFGLIAIAVPLFSGWPQSLIRYMLVVPSIYIFLARLGKAQAFDRAWTIASVLLMGLLTYLYTFDLWVA